MVSTIGMMFGILALAMCAGFLAGIYDLSNRAVKPFALAEGIGGAFLIGAGVQGTAPY
jgi:hypothetical protein